MTGIIGTLVARCPRCYEAVNTAGECANADCRTLGAALGRLEAHVGRRSAEQTKTKRRSGGQDRALPVGDRGDVGGDPA